MSEMPSNKFVDGKGNTWTVTPSLYESGQVAEHLDFELYDFTDGQKGMELIGRLESDDVFLVEVLWYLLQPQMQYHNVKTRDDFLSCFVPVSEVMNKAFDALLEGLRLFFRRSEDQQLIEKLILCTNMAKAKHERELKKAWATVDLKSVVERSAELATNTVDNSELVPETT